ncbi:MAG: NADH-quinone oxidoreductase subunit C [Methermicoccaceae archaeon]
MTEDKPVKEKPPEGLSKEERKEWAKKIAAKRKAAKTASKDKSNTDVAPSQKEKPTYTNPLSDKLKDEFKETLFEISVDRPNRVSARVEAENLKDVIKVLKEKLGFDHLLDISGVDALELKGADPQTLWAVYHLTSYDEPFDPTILELKVVLPRDSPEVDSVLDIYWNADWYERETYELYGIVFKNRPKKLEALFLIEEDIGEWPLRKDFPGYPNPYNAQR